MGGAVWIISVTAVIQVTLTFILAPMIGKLAARFGTKKIMMTGFAGAATAALASFLLPTSVVGMFVYYTVGVAFTTLSNILIWANVADCIDYNYEISGQRQEGIIYSSYSFMRKMGQAIAGFMAGMGLSLIGYDATLDVQSDTTLFGIKVIMFLLPAIVQTICFFLYKFMWNLDSRQPDVIDAAAEPVTV